MSKVFLTRRANRDLIKIENYSIEQWGKDRTDQYMDDLLKGFQKISENPESGYIKTKRVSHFLMARSEQHFAIYQIIEDGIIIAAVLHGKRDIETIVYEMADFLCDEIENIRKIAKQGQ